jgi:WD40 repeat protein
MQTTSRRLFAVTLITAIQSVSECVGAETVPPDFAKAVAPIFAKYCVGCHNATDREGDLSLESFAELQQGGGNGAVMVPGRADASRLVRALIGEVEPAMPPEGNEGPTLEEIAVLRAWIDAGAKGPDGVAAEYPELSVPVITPAESVEQYLTSIAMAPDHTRIALGRYEHVDLLDVETRQIAATTAELPGKVNSIAYSADGALYVAASGIPGLYGVATICRASDGTIVRQVKGHRDALYDARLSPAGDVLATCSYDRQINLWKLADDGLESGTEPLSRSLTGTGRGVWTLVRTLSGHNGAVFELAFSRDGSLLASASADQTVKIWNTATGERLDTLGQPEGEQRAVAFSPDDQWVVAGGADRQVRMWRLVSRDQPRINPLKFSRTAHESPIVELAFSPDGSRLVSASEGRELILWSTAELTPIHRYELQPDVVTGIAFEPEGSGFFVARIDGSWQRYGVPDLSGTRVAGVSKGGRDTISDDGSDPLSRSLTGTGRGDVGAGLGRGDVVETAEQEPNDVPAHAIAISNNAVVTGVIGAAKEDGQADVDLYRFAARKHQQLVLEINAARQKSPLDSRIEVLDAEGNSIPRVVLQAVRPSYFTFRGHDSKSLADFRVHKWQDMELNEYLYANGEVVKLWMYPRGPDSGFLVYPGIDGDRYSYFGTTSVTHAVNAPCYIVEPHAPGTTLIPNGLPEFTIYYENDDDGRRKLGTDSRVAFTAPADGEYLVRVSDTRGLGGDDYRYELVVRAPRPDFQIKVKEANLSVNAGSGKEFSVVAERFDDFDGEIRVEVSGLPPGFHATNPLVIQAGQTTAYGTITADADAPAPTAENAKLAKLAASAIVNGEEVKKEGMPLGELKLAERPKLLVHIFPSSSGQAALVGVNSATDSRTTELIIEPGQTIAAVVRLERNGFDGEVSFGNEHSGRNLPHGVFVDNIGLNGLTLLVGETEREFFITAAKWVPETKRLFHLRTEVEGQQTSWPVVLHVRASPGSDETAKK